MSFGFSPLFSLGLIAAGLSDFDILSYRWLIAALVLMTYAFCKKKSLRLNSFDEFWKVILLSALRSITSVTLLLGYVNISSGIASTINFMYPVIVTICMMLFFGEKRGGTTYQKSSPFGHVSYSKFYEDKQSGNRSYDNRAYYNMPEIIVDNYAEAQTTLYNLQEVIERCGQASVARLYDIVGITGSFTDNRYGWESLAGAGSRRLRDGRYLLILPPTKVLD